MTEQVNETATPQRPLLHRLLHALAEAIGIFVLGGSLIMVGTTFLCHNNHHCNDMGGIVYAIFSIVVTLAVCGLLIKFVARYRDRIDVRKKLDIAVVVAAGSLWALYFYFLA